jgi:hypothetical protein
MPELMSAKRVGSAQTPRCVSGFGAAAANFSRWLKNFFAVDLRRNRQGLARLRQCLGQHWGA